MNEFPEIAVVQRCFALAPTPDSIVRIFGSKAAGKAEILRHWRAANENDEAHRICADKMACQPFDYPYSTPGLLACKAAEMEGGQQAHWDYFDCLQQAHLTECRNIGEPAVLIDCARDVGLDVEKFLQDLQSDATLQAVQLDIDRAYQLGVHAVPTIVLEDGTKISGAVDYQTLKQAYLSHR